MAVGIGRPRKPASLKKGQSETKTQLAAREAEEEKLIGDVHLLVNVPDYLDILAQDYYLFLINELEISNILCNLDIPVLEQTSDCLSKMRQCDSILNKEGLIIEWEDRYGATQIKEHPAVSVKQKYLNQFRALCNQLGLSPASRAQLAGLKLQKEKDDNDPLLQVLKS